MVQIMLATQPDTFINALLNTSIQLSVNVNVFSEAQGDKNLLIEDQFRVLKQCHGKFDCLIYEMLLTHRRTEA